MALAIASQPNQTALAHHRVVLGQEEGLRAAPAAHPADVPQHPDEVQRLLPHPRAGDVARVIPVVHPLRVPRARVHPAPVRVHRALERDLLGHVLGARGAVERRAEPGVLGRGRVRDDANRHAVEPVRAGARASLAKERIQSPRQVLRAPPRDRGDDDQEGPEGG